MDEGLKSRFESAISRNIELFREMRSRSGGISVRFPQGYHVRMNLPVTIGKVVNLSDGAKLTDMEYCGPLETIAIDTRRKEIARKRYGQAPQVSVYDSIDDVLKGMPDELTKLVEERRKAIEDHASGIEIVTKQSGKHLHFRITGW